MAEKTVMTVSISILFKEHIERVAAEKDMSTSKYIREVLAEATGYDLDGENKNRVETRGRPRIYANEEERLKAKREQQRERDELARRLMQDHQRQQRQRDADALYRSLQRKGAL